MTEDLARSAGFALSWRAVQHIGVKLIYLARLLILAHLLSPEDFGLLAIATLSVDLLLTITDFGMVQALVQRADPDERHFDAAWTVGVVRAAAITLIVAIAAPLIADIFAEPRATNIIRLLALRPVLESSASIGMVRLTRQFRFRSLATLWLIEALTNTVVTIALASTLGVWALVVGALSAPIVMSILSYVAAPHRPRLRFDSAAIGELVRFGRWVFVTALIGLAGRSVLQATISRQLGVVELGMYSLAAKLAFLPAEISGAVIGSVAFPLFSRLQSNAEKTAIAFRTLFTGLIALILPVVAMLVVLSSTLVREVLDEKWQGTGPIIAILAVACAIGIFGDVVVPMFFGMGRPQRVTVLEALQSTVLILAVWLLAQDYGLFGAASAWIPAVLASQVLSVIYLRTHAPHCLSGLGAPMGAVLVASLAAAGIAALIDSVISGLAGLVVAATAGLAVAAAIILLADRWIHLGMVRSVQRVFPRVGRWLGALQSGV
jgi:O-antigen/teichoic acid export membrane protein